MCALEAPSAVEMVLHTNSLAHCILRGYIWTHSHYLESRASHMIAKLTE